MNPDIRDPAVHAPPDDRGWSVTPGVHLLGPVQGSGLRDVAFLVRRSDDQMVQLSELLYLVLVHLDGDRTSAEVAEDVSAAYGRTLTREGLTHLITTRLEPLGLVYHHEGGPVRPPLQARPLLSLTAQGTLIPAWLTRHLSWYLSPLYRWPVVLLALMALVASDVALFRGADFWTAVIELFTTPTLALAMYGLLTLGAVIHELGHAAACRYGGAEPGEVGVGVYIVFLAFYTDVTESYRLDRTGRVRTDLGGLYFNVFCVVGLTAAYFATGSGLFLLSAVVMQVQMLQQLIPVVRFDGYYVLADVAGVPDLFARVGPVLRSLRPGHPTDPRVSELRPHARRVVTGWVLVVVPLLTFALCWAIWHLPEFVRLGRAGIAEQQRVFDVAWATRDWASMGIAVLSIALILVPFVGMAVVLWRLAGSLVRLVRAGAARRTREKEETMATLESRSFDVPKSPPTALSAADFNDETMLPPKAPPPQSGWRRAVYVGSAQVINPGPGPEDLRREELDRRLRTPIDGSRRVVVMSRKGGVGKTTISLALGSTFAMLRGDRVIAVDANPDAGNLAHRVARPHERNVTDVLRDLDAIDNYALLRSYTSQAIESRLEVLGSDDDPRIGMALDRNDYHRLITLLDRFYNLILLDTGTGILDSANQGLLSEADQLVLVLRPGLDGGRAAALTLDWMDEHGFGELVEHAVVVVNAQRRGGAPPDLMRRHFEKRCDRVVTIPWDPALEKGAQTDLSSLRQKTRESVVEVAAAVADNFAKTGAHP